MNVLAWRRWWRSEGQSALRHLALEHWDPLGVYGEAEALDRYDPFMARAARMLRAGRSADEIAKYLSDVRTKALERSEAEDTDAAFAEALVAWYAHAAPPR